LDDRLGESVYKTTEYVLIGYSSGLAKKKEKSTRISGEQKTGHGIEKRKAMLNLSFFSGGKVKETVMNSRS